MISLAWGIIGPGNIAHDFARDLALVHPLQKITAVFGNTPEHTAEFCREFNVPSSFNHLDDFIANAGIDIAYIATPHPMHFEQALACLEHKIHVLCEKPLVLNADQCSQLIAASERTHTFLMEAMWIRFLPPLQQVLTLLTREDMGKLLSVKAFMGYRAPKEKGSRYFNPELGGGSLLDLGIYPLYLSHLLLGSPCSVKAIASFSETGVDETCSILLGYTDKAHAILESSLLSQSQQPAEIACEKGIIRILDPWYEKSAGIELELYGKGKQFFPTAWEGHGLQFEIDEVLHCIYNGHHQSEYISHAFTLSMFQTMDAVREQIGLEYKNYEPAQ